jgi:hypothetical protein
VSTIPRPLAGGLLATIAVAGACAPGCTRPARTDDAPRVVRAIELLRDAPNDEKAPHLRALVAEPCSSPDVCVLKELCVGAYERHVRALDAQRTIQHGLRAGAASADLQALLERTADDLARARDAAQRCADEEARVRSAHGL